jgi:sugar phosphate isomerase/epimerase
MPQDAINPHIHIPYEKIEKYIQFILEHKLNLEIYFNADTLDSISTSDILSLQKTLNYSPSLSFHAPFMDLAPAAIDSKVKKATIERFNQVLNISEILNPKAIVFHSGYEKWKYALNMSIWLNESLEIWTMVNERAKKKGVKIAVENIFEDEPENIRLLMEKMNSDNFGVCFDTGHCNLFTKAPLQEWLNSLAPYIIELHLHDNDRSADLHLPIGDGNFDFNMLFSKLRGKDYIYTIESHTPERVLKSIDRLRDFLQPFRLISDAKAV